MVMGKQETGNDYAPFRDELSEANIDSSGYFSRITTFENNPDLVIRIRKQKSYNYFSKIQGVNVLAVNRCELLKLEKHGLTLPRFMSVLGAIGKLNPVTYFIITDRIYGVDLRQLRYSELSQDELANATKQIDTSFTGIASYLHERSRKSGWYIADASYNVRHTQFMYGRRRGETESRVYYVDLGPTLQYYSVDDISFPDYYEVAVRDLYYLISSTERRLNSVLDDSRVTLSALLLDLYPKSWWLKELINSEGRFLRL
ncbi:MAG: hypothetical protein PHV63_02060 [Candidatus Daviesbacteria bacterium]|nr:hypothetical protein [Candidatus Daviesbacteria bacterium]